MNYFYERNRVCRRLIWLEIDLSFWKKGERASNAEYPVFWSRKLRSCFRKHAVILLGFNNSIRKCHLLYYFNLWAYFLKLYLIQSHHFLYMELWSDQNYIIIIIQLLQSALQISNRKWSLKVSLRHKYQLSADIAIAT